MKVPSYKGKDGGNGCSTILQHLKQLVTLPPDAQLALQNNDVLDNGRLRASRMWVPKQREQPNE